MSGFKFGSKFFLRTLISLNKNNNIFKIQIRPHSRDVIKRTYRLGGMLDLIELFQKKSTEQQQIKFLHELETYFLPKYKDPCLQEVYDECLSFYKKLKSNKQEKVQKKSCTDTSASNSSRDTFCDDILIYETFYRNNHTNELKNNVIETRLERDDNELSNRNKKVHQKIEYIEIFNNHNTYENSCHNNNNDSSYSDCGSSDSGGDSSCGGGSDD